MRQQNVGACSEASPYCFGQAKSEVAGFSQTSMMCYVFLLEDVVPLLLADSFYLHYCIWDGSSLNTFSRYCSFQGGGGRGLNYGKYNRNFFGKVAFSHLNFSLSCESQFYKAVIPY
jgi:hypothetical protein